MDRAVKKVSVNELEYICLKCLHKGRHLTALDNEEYIVCGKCGSDYIQVNYYDKNS